jgi:hypothetical protein
MKALTAAQRRNFRTRNKIRLVNVDRVKNRETRPRLSVHRPAGTSMHRLLMTLRA